MKKYTKGILASEIQLIKIRRISQYISPSRNPKSHLIGYLFRMIELNVNSDWCESLDLFYLGWEHYLEKHWTAISGNSSKDRALESSWVFLFKKFIQKSLSISIVWRNIHWHKLHYAIVIFCSFFHHWILCRKLLIRLTTLKLHVFHKKGFHIIPETVEANQIAHLNASIAKSILEYLKRYPFKLAYAFHVIRLI